MKQRYQKTMEWLYLACIVLSGTALVVMFSFIGGAAVYRANAQIAVEALLKAVGPKARVGMTWGVHACMALTALFMLGYGVHLCELTWYNTMAEFPDLRVGIVYMPIPVGGLLTFLFLVEKAWIGDPPKTDVMYSDQAAELE